MENIESKQSRGFLLTSILIISFIVFFIQSIIALLGIVGSTFFTFLEVAISDESEQFIGPFFYFILLMITGFIGLVGGSSVWKLKRSGASTFYVASIISFACAWGVSDEFNIVNIIYLIFILTVYISRYRLN